MRRRPRATAGRRASSPMNALVDDQIIGALYRASQAGVDVDLIVRGICCLRPGVPGVSERIRVISIVGRFLEHSRLFYFLNGGDERFFIGSADWMPRNLNRRVEVVAPVDDTALHPRLRALLETCLADNRQAWDLLADGSYVQRQPVDDAERATHRLLLRDAWGRDRAAERSRSGEFPTAMAAGD
jgi:polyphosphate kinase